MRGEMRACTGGCKGYAHRGVRLDVHMDVLVCRKPRNLVLKVLHNAEFLITFWRQRIWDSGTIWQGMGRGWWMKWTTQALQ